MGGNDNRNRPVRNGIRVQQQQQPLTPKYTTGLGDGHVEDSTASHSTTNLDSILNINDDEVMVQKVIKARLQNRQQQQHHHHHHHRQKLRNNNNNNDQDDPPPEAAGNPSNDPPAPNDVTVMFPDGNDKNNHNSQNFRGYTGSNFQFPMRSRIHIASRPTTGSGIRRSSSSSGGNRIIRHAMNDPWEAPTMYFVAATAIVVVSAVVVHLIAIGTNHHHHNQNKNSHSNKQFHNNNGNNNNSEHTSTTTIKKQKRQKVLLKKYSIIKKEDGYNEDAEDDDDDLPNDSARQHHHHHHGGGTSVTTAGSSSNGISDSERTTVLDDVAMVSHHHHPLLMHQYHHNNNNSNNINSPSYHQKPTSIQLQPQYRHRKNSSSTISITAVVAGPGLSYVAPPPQLPVQQATTGTSTSNAMRNHYLNQSGSAVMANSTVPKSPMIHHRTVMASQHPTTAVLGYCPPSPLAPRIAATTTTLYKELPPIPLQLQQRINNHHQVNVHQSQQHQHPNNRSVPSALNARPISASKLSFESLLIDGNSSFDHTDNDDESEALSLTYTPRNHHDRSRPVLEGGADVATALTVPSTSVHDTQQQQHDDAALSTPKMSQNSTKKYGTGSFSERSAFESTPRIVNGGSSGRQQHNRMYPSHLPQPPPVPEDSPLMEVDCSISNQYDVQQQQRYPTVPLMPPPPLVGRTPSRGVDLSFAQSPGIKEEDRLLGSMSSRCTINERNGPTKMMTADSYRQFENSPNVLRHDESSHHHYDRQPINNNNRNAMVMPFVPNLAVEQYHDQQSQQQHFLHEPPPQSVNLDQFQLERSMESGNMSHWAKQIVSEESKQIQSQIFPCGVASNNNILGRVLKEAERPGQTNSEGTLDKSSTIPSDAPRNSIEHKRDVLTDSTDSAASLQGSIDFTELELIEEIGGGGFGQVWKASWRDTPVAVKILTGSAQSKRVPRAVLEEFAAEINLLKGMRHPNICLYMGACLKPPNRAIITELAVHGSLWDALRLTLDPPYVPCDGISRDGWPDCLYVPDERHGAPPTSMSPPSIVNPAKGTWHWLLVKRVAVGTARGMSYLHGGKVPVLHRDLKSANILLDASYKAKVCDFGLSRLKEEERSMTGNCGTVQWMAPEVLANLPYNEKADVYSYGVILWELLTRQCPYDKLSPIQCALAVLQKDHRPTIPKWCPPSFYALIQACWKKNPNERPTFPEILVVLKGMPGMDMDS